MFIIAILHRLHKAINDIKKEPIFFVLLHVVKYFIIIRWAHGNYLIIIIIITNTKNTQIYVCIDRGVHIYISSHHRRVYCLRDSNYHSKQILFY